MSMHEQSEAETLARAKTAAAERNSQVAEAITRLTDDVDQLENMVHRLEGRLGNYLTVEENVVPSSDMHVIDPHVPVASSLHGIAERMENVRCQLAGIVERFEG